MDSSTSQERSAHLDNINSRQLRTYVALLLSWTGCIAGFSLPVIGTGMSVPKVYPEKCAPNLAMLTGVDKSKYQKK